MKILRAFAILFLVLAIGLAMYDAARYVRGGPFEVTTIEKLRTLAGGEQVFALRARLWSALGSTGELLAVLPAMIVSGALALIFFALSWRPSRPAE